MNTELFRPLQAPLWQAYSLAEQRLTQAWLAQQGDLLVRLDQLALQARLLSDDLRASEQPLLHEWQLRRWLFLLANLALASASDWQRQALLDRLYQPLLELYAMYRSGEDGAARQFALQAELHRLFNNETSQHFAP